MLRRLARSLAQSPRVLAATERLEAAFPPLRIWHRAQYHRHFQKFYPWERLFSGVYPTFAEALAHIPKDRPIGYDNPETATFLGTSSPMLPSEYPVLFWLTRLLSEEANTVFDFGGYLALGYNWYRPFNILPPNIRWTIYDVPAVVAEGKRILDQTPDPALTFTTDLTLATHSDIFFAAGSLHFEQRSLATMLASLPTLPRHLLLNKLPLTHHPTFYTLHNMGPAIAPYRIANREEFLESLTVLGYELKDAWANPELTAHIPFHPDESVQAFAGLYLHRLS